MKNIKKNGCPPKYAQWCNKVSGTDKEDYNELPPTEKQTLLDTLLAEQGFICGYTMKRISRDTAHIEHIKPQSLCRVEKQGSDLDYKNLIACYPRKGMNAKYRYGAQQKGDWWENDGRQFVSPLDSTCESHFHFDIEGNITSSSVPAAITIEVLALAHTSLTEDRKRVLEEFIFGSDKRDPISLAGANRAISYICNERNGDGQYYEFCIAIRDALKKHISSLEILRLQKRALLRRV